MTAPPIPIRTFILTTILVLLLVPSLAGGAGWLIERDRQDAHAQQQLNKAIGYLTSRRNQIRAQNPAALQEFTALLDRLNVLAQVTLRGPGKKQLYPSPTLLREDSRLLATPPRIGPTGAGTSWLHEQKLIPPRTAGSQDPMVADLYYRPSSGSARALVAVLAGAVVFLAGLAVAVWLAGRWMVFPLTRLSAQLDRVAGGDLMIAIPQPRIGEIANIAQAVDGMTAALGETERQRAQTDQARQFLITGIAHDLRTPLFALRGHLQAIGSHFGNPTVHLQRAEARADALERLIGNLFAYTSDDYTQPTLQLETVPIAELLKQVTAALEHAAHLQRNTFELDGDPAIGTTVDRERIKRALTNILDNAIRYSPPGAPIHITWTALDDSTVQINIQDHGPGIDPSLLQHIFEPGIRSTPPAGSPNGGTGLGLTIAKRLLEHQHATLTAENHPGAGAELHLTLQRPPPTTTPAD